MNDLDLANPPSFLEDALPVQRPGKEAFPDRVWIVTGTQREHLATKPRSERYYHAYPTANDALEAAPKDPSPHWEWDGKPPYPVSIWTQMAKAEERGFAGVVLKNGENEDLAVWEIKRT